MTAAGPKAGWGFVSDGLLAIAGPMAGTYFIPARDLLRRDHVIEDHYFWPMHVAAETWVDARAFCAVFEAAAHRHHPGLLDAEAMRRTTANAVFHEAEVEGRRLGDAELFGLARATPPRILGEGRDVGGGVHAQDCEVCPVMRAAFDRIAEKTGETAGDFIEAAMVAFLEKRGVRVPADPAASALARAMNAREARATRRG